MVYHYDYYLQACSAHCSGCLWTFDVLLLARFPSYATSLRVKIRSVPSGSSIVHEDNAVDHDHAWLPWPL